MSETIRCFGEGIPIYEEYHDHEWGRPTHDDQKLFEMLILEGAQAGLSWITVLKKREAYRKAFLITLTPRRLRHMTMRKSQSF